ncbi:hypothetical protein MMC29_005503 [Sticta canariensis]|nr:hypothetical protein [Sticta canariensis]
MAMIEPPATFPNSFVLNHDEAYAGISTAEWEAIVEQSNFLKPVQLDDIEPDKLECDICRQSFGSADDGGDPEMPVALPCGHIFGKDCVSDWIATEGGHDDVQSQDDHADEGPVEELYSSDGLKNFNDLLPVLAVGIRMKDFTCPKCRAGFTAQAMPEKQTTAIEVQLRFWDLAYKKIGIIRSIEEDAARKDLWLFVKAMKPKQKAVNPDRIRSYVLRAQVSAMRFALRRARSDLTSLQCQLRDALFNLGCCGLDGPPDKYCAESCEDQRIPFWCWQFEQIERGMNPNHHRTNGQEHSNRIFQDWEQQRLGPWRRKLFAELEDDRAVYASEEWWEAWYDAQFVWRD